MEVRAMELTAFGRPWESIQYPTQLKITTDARMVNRFGFVFVLEFAIGAAFQWSKWGQALRSSQGNEPPKEIGTNGI
jgi:hypothetical protein